MKLSNRHLASLAPLAFAMPAAAQVDFSPVTDPIDAYLADRPGIEGAGLLIAGFDGTVVHEQYWGTYDRDTSIRVASATKWLSGGLIVSLADDGLIDLDRPVEQVLPAFAGSNDGRGDTTVRQMFSHTSGMRGGSFWIGNDNVTLEQAVDNLAASPTLMVATPGGEFRYGGVSMHVAGRVAEVVGGDDWVDLFDARVAGPLETDAIRWDGVGVPTNPRIAGGAAASVDAYARFLTMLGNGGVFEGRRVLSEAAVATMLADQTDGAVPTSVPGSIDAYLGYGIGAWIERRDDAGNPVEFSSPGAFGTTPWIDLENEYFGVFLIDDALANIDGGIDNVRDFAAARIDAAPGLAGDADRDGDVDLSDFAILRATFGTFPGRYVAGDLDGDADVDLADFGILRANFGEADLEPLDAWHATLIPEPAAGVGLLLVAARRAARRRNMR